MSTYPGEGQNEAETTHATFTFFFHNMKISDSSLGVFRFFLLIAKKINKTIKTDSNSLFRGRRLNDWAKRYNFQVGNWVLLIPQWIDEVNC